MRVSRFFRRVVCAVIMIALSSAGSREASAYCQEVHYALTYYLARIVGYTPEQCRRLASACQSVDDCAVTEPIQAGKWVDPIQSAQQARTKFHAFMDQQKYPHCLNLDKVGQQERELAQADIVAQRKTLFRAAHHELLLNPGVMLHFLQDETAHIGFGSYGGHWTSTGMLVDQLYPPGAYADYLAAHNCKYHLPMVRSTLSYMSKFMTDVCPAQPHREFEWQHDVVRVINLLREANPAGNRVVAINLAEPDLEGATRVVEAALKERGDLTPYNRVQTHFDFDKDGKPSNTVLMNQCPLFGKLQVKLTGSAPSAALPVGVTVKLASGFKNDSAPHILAERSVSVAETSFANLPIGDLTVEVRNAAGACVSKPVKLTGYNNTLEVEIPGMIDQAR